MEIQDPEGRAKCISAEKKINFIFQSEKDSIHAYVLLSLYNPFPCTHTLWEVLYMIFYSFCVPPEKDS